MDVGVLSRPTSVRIWRMASMNGWLDVADRAAHLGNHDIRAALLAELDDAPLDPLVMRMV